MFDTNEGAPIIRHTIDGVVDITSHNLHGNKKHKGKCEPQHPISKLPKDIGNNPVKVKNQNPIKDDTKNNKNPPNKVDKTKHQNKKK